MNFNSQHAHYQKQCEQALKYVADTMFPSGSVVSQAAIYALLNGGKRVRGVLTLATCEMLGGDLSVAEKFAAAIEMIHAFSLIHDDLPCMDDDDMRRGKPATHIQFGEANALLAGDLLALEAPRVIAEAPHASDQQKVAAITLLCKYSGANGMILGQELDLRYENEPIPDEKALLNVYKHKTGALIHTAVQLGAIAADKANEDTKSINCYANNIGMTFQIVDDILDVTSTSEVLGKPIGSDEKSNKSTYLSFKGLESSKNKVAELTEEANQALQTQYGERSSFLIAYSDSLAKRVW